MLLAPRILVRHLSRVIVSRGHATKVAGVENRKLAVSNQNAPLQRMPPIPPRRAKSKYDSPQPESGRGEKVLRFDLGGGPWLKLQVSRLIEAHRGSSRLIEAGPRTGLDDFDAVFIRVFCLKSRGSSRLIEAGPRTGLDDFDAIFMHVF